MPPILGLYKSLPTYVKWITGILLLIFLHFGWSHLGRNNISNTYSLKVREISEVGAENYSANIVCIQPYMLPNDYASIELFYNKIDGYFAKAKEESLLKNNTIVVFPEHLGTPLFFIDEKSSVLQTNSLQKASLLAIASNFWRYMICAFELSDFNFSRVFSHLKAEQVSKVYQFVFSSMAKKYQVHVLSGSILLPKPSLNNGVVKTQKGHLENISLIYLPSGRLSKTILIEKNSNTFEKKLTKKRKQETTNQFSTSFGDISIFIGDDIWDIPKNNQQTIIINPYSSFSSLEIKNNEYFNELQIDTNFNTNLTLESCFIEQLSSSSVRKNQAIAVSLFTRGKAWGQTFEGRTLINYKGEMISGFDVEGASIISVGIP